MKIIIDIDEQWYYQIKKENSFKCGNTLYDTCIESVAKGTPLPKEHGRLIDADILYREIETEGWFDSNDEYYGGGLEDIVLNAPTIIEADKGE